MEKKIFFHDTDAGGVVYYANYLKYLEEARTEFLENKGLGVASFHERGLFYAVSRCTVAYRSPARYGDIILCEAKLTKLTAAQLVFEQKIFDKGSGRLLVEAEVNLVCLNKDFRPVPLPDDLRDSLLN